MTADAGLVLRVDRLAYGGQGVGTLPSGRRIFVPLTAPGDLIEAEILVEKAQHARGRMTRLIEGGASRVAPVCRHAGSCGGCQLQHVAVAAQEQAKEEAFYAALERLGGVPRTAIADARPIIACPRPFRYRGRCRLAVDGASVGFCGWRSRTVVGLGECPLLVPRLEELMLAVSHAQRRRPLAGLVEISLCVGDGGTGGDSGGGEAEGAGDLPAEGAISLRLEREREREQGPEPGWRRAMGSRAGAGRERQLAEAVAWTRDLLATVPGLRGAVLLAQDVPPLLVGDPTVHRRAPLCPGRELLGRPDLFAQANLALGERLVEIALELLSPREDEHALELYAGSGQFTLALADRVVELTAVEGVRDSLDLARAAACVDVGGRAPPILFICDHALPACRHMAGQGRRFDLALVDPPREGAKDLPLVLAALGPRRIAYVSCDPTTLSRDVKAFLRLGYRLAAAVPLDLFPQTYHLEGVALLERERF